MTNPIKPMPKEPSNTPDHIYRREFPKFQRAVIEHERSRRIEAEKLLAWIFGELEACGCYARPNIKCGECRYKELKRNIEEATKQ